MKNLKKLGIVGSLVITLISTSIVANANANDITGHWAESTIKEFMNAGYTDGYADGTFKPNNSITRAEFVTIFNNYFGLTTKGGKSFIDTRNHWAKDAIDIAVTNGVCNGVTSIEFKPNDPITREQAAVMISNYKDLSMIWSSKYGLLKDKYSVSNWSQNAVIGMLSEDFMKGYSDGTFKPQGKITRAEAVSTLSRISNTSPFVNKTILDNDIAKVDILRKGKSEYGYYTLSVKITNKTNKAITLSTNDTYVNGKNTYSNCSLKVAPGKTVTGDIEFNYAAVKSFNNFIDIHGYIKIFDPSKFKTLNETLFEIK
ncbi:S-layer homology domain-containing protein [Romboutsia lituseburensis]|uniref:S-layer homology domain-containing protein n=1 Tax=Romboutsia lituseburensis TaxID=1537 RepID=UPI00215B122D|nr:S-layer homology domain-containing protein [Romboutsia lituseburensis]MCR8744325.1 S-layer homology domain-containing protein [Romboutsia lituseburensis]